MSDGLVDPRADDLTERRGEPSTGVPVVKRLFRRFVAMWGAQKVGAMWADVPIRQVHAAWAEALDGVSLEGMRRAITAMERAGRDWPPGSAEFAKMARDLARPAVGMTALLDLPPDNELASPATARAALADLAGLLQKTNVTAALSGPDPGNDGFERVGNAPGTRQDRPGAVFFPVAVVHLSCGGETRLTPDLTVAYSRVRPVYDGAYCRVCDAHFPLFDFDWFDNRRRRRNR